MLQYSVSVKIWSFKFICDLFNDAISSSDYTVKTTVFWDIAPCSPVKIDRRFLGAYCIHRGDDGDNYHLWNVGQLCESTRCTSQKKVIFILAALRMWNFTDLMIINNELEKLWEETAMVWVEVLSWKFHGETEETHETPFMISCHRAKTWNRDLLPDKRVPQNLLCIVYPVRRK
jgi:hypothetical protein